MAFERAWADGELMLPGIGDGVVAENQGSRPRVRASAGLASSSWSKRRASLSESPVTTPMADRDPPASWRIGTLPRHNRFRSLHPDALHRHPLRRVSRERLARRRASRRCPPLPRLESCAGRHPASCRSGAGRARGRRRDRLVASSVRRGAGCNRLPLGRGPWLPEAGARVQAPGELDPCPLGRAPCPRGPRGEWLRDDHHDSLGRPPALAAPVARRPGSPPTARRASAAAGPRHRARGRPLPDAARSSNRGRELGGRASRRARGPRSCGPRCS